MRRLGLVMMLIGAAGSFIGYLGSISPWALDFNLWLYPDFLEEGLYPEWGFVWLLMFSLVIWFLGAVLRNARSTRKRA
ncbi:UNVERIFIED_ORG: hypothetical protein GGI57_006421 [Rhizobium aethiopicum]